MSFPRWMVHFVALVGLAMGAGCASRPPPAEPAPVVRAGTPAFVGHGRITRIEVLEGRGEATGAGAVVGGVTGAVIGRQFGGSTSGKNTGTVLGAIAGAVIGHEIEKDQAGARERIRISVALDRGGMRYFESRDAGDLRIGDRVRIEGDRLYRD